jgi:hypothetical protein
MGRPKSDKPMETNINFRIPKSLASDYAEIKRLIEDDPDLVPEVGRRGSITRTALIREAMVRFVDEVKRAKAKKDKK